MLNFLKNLIENPSDDSDSVTNEKRIQIATCVLLIEMAKTDDEFAGVENEAIQKILRQEMRLSEEDAQEIFDIALQEQQDATDFWHYAKLISRNYNDDEKQKVIEMIWKVVYADGKLDEYEDYLIHKLSYVLHIPHKQLMDAKMKVKNRSK